MASFRTLEDLVQRSVLPSWPGIDEASVETMCTVMARRLQGASARAIGVLPAAGSVNLGPLLVRLATGLAGFTGGKVGVIPRWRSWAGDPDGAAGDASGLRLRAMGANVVAIVPPACPNSRAAALVLQDALWSLPGGIARVLVDLGGYGAEGLLPGASAVADGIVLAVPVRRARRAGVAKLLAAIPEGKCLGTILVG
jgi:hypothetical protein